MTPLKYSLKTVKLMTVYFGKELKYLEENKVIYNKQTKNGNYFYIPKRDRETISSPINKTPVIYSPNNSILTPKTSNTISP